MTGCQKHRNKGGNVAQELYQNGSVLMLCYLLKIFSFGVKKNYSDADPAAAAGAGAASAAASVFITAFAVVASEAAAEAAAVPAAAGSVSE